MANTTKRTKAEIFEEVLSAKLAGKEVNRSAVVSELAESYTGQRKQLPAEKKKAEADARKAAEAARKRREEAAQAARKQQLEAAVASAASQSKAASKAYNDYQKSDERKGNVDAATNEMLKKIFGNLGAGNVDIALQNAPQQMLEAETTEKTLKAKKDYAEQQEKTAKDTKTLHADLDELGSWTAEDKAGLEAYIREENGRLYERSWDTLSTDTNPESIALIKKYGEAKVREMAESLSRSRSQKLTQEVAEQARENAGSGAGGAIGHSLGSVGANVLSGVSGLVGYAGELSGRTGRYTTLDPNNAGQLPSVYAGAVREQVASDIEGDGSFAGKVGSTLYKAGMGAADTVARAGLGGGSKLVSLGLAAGQSFGNTVSQASRQGVSGGQAMLLGAVNAGIEAATEFIPLDNLMNLAKTNVTGAKKILTEVLKQAGMEIAEEEINLIAGTLAEGAILQEKSGYNQQIQEKIAQGASYEQAKLEADRALLAQAKETAIVSGLSGGMSAGVTVSAKTTKEKLDAAIKEALGANKNTAPVDGANEQPAIKNPTYEELTGKKDIPIVNVGRNAEGKSYAQLKTEALQKATNEKWFDEPHTNADTGMPIFLTNKTFSHAFSNLRADFGTDTILAMNHLPELIRDAVLTNVADPKNPNKPESKVYTFLAAINGESGTEPVKLTVKEYNSNSDSPLPKNILEYFKRNKASRTNNRLYDVKALEVIGIERAETEKESGASAIVADGPEPNANSTPNSIIKVADLVDLVKGDAEKYIPKRNRENPSAYRPQEADTAKQSAEGGQKGKTSYDEYILRNDDGTPFEAMGAASLGNSGKLDYDSLLYDGNIQRFRKGDAREIEVPIEDADGRKVSEFVGNSMNSELTPETFTDTIKRIVADGKVSHDVQTNEETLQKAAEQIENEGSIHESVQNIRAVAESGKASPEDIAKATLLYENLTEQINQKIKNDDEPDKLLQDMAEDVYISLAQLATNSGRSLQMFNLFRRMTPEYQAKVLEKEVIREVEKLKKRGTVKKDYQVQVDADLMEEYKKAAEANRKADGSEEKKETEQKMQEIQNAIYLTEAAKLPATFKAKWDAWRYMAMLGNVKTQVRNFFGNAGFKPYVEMKNAMGTALEAIFIRDKGKRTKAGLHRVFSKDDRALRRWAKADAKSENMKDVLKGSSKLGDDMTRSNMADNMHIFNTKLFEKARNTVNDVVEVGDLLFKNPYYADALAGFIKAKGYTMADIEAGNVSDDVLNEGRAYAVDEAMKATFNDCNVLSDFLANEMRYKGDNPIGKAANTMLEGILPFRRTPANILARFTEYSPVGIAKGVVNTIRHVAGGDVSAATAIDQLASGLTGTGMAALGYALANGLFGLKLRGSNVDEDEERQGHQQYALEFSIGGKEYSYTIDWAAPANLPLFLGANLYEIIHNQDENMDMSGFTSFVYSMGTMFEPMLELSCLSSLNDIFEAGKYADGTALYSVAVQAATSYFTQGIPSLVRQTNQVFQDNKQQTFANAADPLVRDLQRRAANIPLIGNAFKTDKVDEWGETESNGNWFQRVLNSYFNPGTLKAIDNSALEKEVTRLNEAQPDSVSPPDTPKTITYTDSNGDRHRNRRLTEQEYNTLATVQGQTAQKILDTLIESKSYKALTDEQKAEAFGYAYDYAREKGRTEAIEGYAGLDGWMEGIEGKESKAILDKILSGSLTDAFNSVTESWREGTQADVSGDLESAYETYNGMTDGEKAAFKEDNSGRIAKYLEAREHGIETDTYLDLYKSYYSLEKDEAKTSTQKAQEWALTVEQAREKGIINEDQKEHLRGSLTFRYSKEVETEKFDEMTSAGIDSEKAFNVADLLRGIEPQTGYKTVRDIQKAETIMESDLSEADKIAALKIYGTDAQDKNLEEMTDMGFSAADYVEAWRIYADGSGTGKKARAIAQYQKEFGVDKATAKAIYEIYG